MTEQVKKEAKKTNYKLVGLILFFIAGITTLISLYIHFEYTYKRTAKEITATTTQITTALPTALPKTLPTVLKATNTDSSESENKSEELQKNTPSNSFIATYLQIKFEAEQGKDFSNELGLLKQYKSSTEINNILLELTNLSKHNIDDNYFRITFNNMIRKLYEEKDNTTNMLHNYIRRFANKLIFVRPTNHRAIIQGGFDMNIALAKKALESSDLSSAQIYINDLPNNALYFQKFKLKLQTRIDIKNHLITLDNLILKGEL